MGKKSHRGRPSFLAEKQDNELENDLSLSKEKLNALQSQQLAFQEARKGIAQVYHPYDLSTGAARQPEQV